ncbi:Sec-independent protein translocase protein TatB [Paraburkholderia fungorum]|uniref:Sec-independent protein translocase protein TatB n=1 Tax=Paraburkholderia fungorum TaxID=134537 RepID=UPI0038BC2546
MLDLGLTKMAVIGVVALIVLGPERLPRVARTAGALLGRAQRHISDVKDEVTREIELTELQQVKSEFVAAAANIENAIHEDLRGQAADLKVAWNDGYTASPDAEEAAAQLPLQAPDAVPWRSGIATRPKRRNWRGQQAVTPTWYKRTAARRRHLQSVAARVARHPSAYPAAREGFFNV